MSVQISSEALVAAIDNNAICIEAGLATAALADFGPFEFIVTLSVTSIEAQPPSFTVFVGVTAKGSVEIFTAALNEVAKPFTISDSQLVHIRIKVAAIVMRHTMTPQPLRDNIARAISA